MSRVNASSICIRHGLIQFKILHRLHLSRSRLAKLYPNIDPRCERCHQTEATLSQMFWSCSRLSSFWLSSFDGISCVCKKRINEMRKLTNMVVSLQQATSPPVNHCNSQSVHNGTEEQEDWPDSLPWPDTECQEEPSDQPTRLSV